MSGHDAEPTWPGRESAAGEQPAGAGPERGEVRASPSTRAARSFPARIAVTAVSLPGLSSARDFQLRDRRRAGSVLAAGIAARAFLMLLPLSFLVSAVVGFLTDADPGLPTHAGRAVGLTAVLVRTIGQSSGDARRARWVLLSLGAVVLVYAVSSLYRALRLTHAVVWDVRPGRAQTRTTVLVCALLVLTPLAGSLASVVRSQLPGLLQVAAVPATLLFFCAIWLWVSWLLPHRADRWWALLPGSIAWGFGIIVMQLISVSILPRLLSSSSELYGVLAVASVAMLWLFVVGRLMVAAASLNALLWERRQAPRPSA